MILLYKFDFDPDEPSMWFGPVDHRLDCLIRCPVGCTREDLKDFPEKQLIPNSDGTFIITHRNTDGLVAIDARMGRVFAIYKPKHENP
jgi:hypothetical protein